MRNDEQGLGDDSSTKVLRRKVLICVESLAYNRGGIASIGRIMARTYSKAGWNVTVLTHNVDGKFNFENVRIVVNPSKLEIFREFFCSEYVISVGDLLRLVWPLLLIKRKAIIVKHGSVNAKSSIHRFVEQLLAKRVVWGGVSQFVVDHDNVKGGKVVPNARDPEIFFTDGSVKKYDLLFVGGMTEEKGIFTLADAMEVLKNRGVSVNKLTMVGEGKDFSRFMKYVGSRLPKGCAFEMTGNLDALGVADQMRKHRCVIVPSMNIVWQEAFPLVPIEAQSCGCQVIVSESGGLPESGGPCAQVFPCGDYQKLACCIENVLLGRHVIDPVKVKAHLDMYTPQNMMEVYNRLVDERFA